MSGSDIHDPKALEALLGALSPFCSVSCLEALRRASSALPGRLSPEGLRRPEPLFVAVSGARETLLHSRRSPALEASRQLSDWRASLNGAPKSLVAVAGLGGAHHLKALFEELPQSSTVFLADPAPAEFLAGALAVDLPSLLSKGGPSFRFSASSDPELLASELDAELDSRGLLLPSLFVHPGCARAFPDDYKALLERLRAHGRRRFLECKTLGSLCGEWLLNSLDNLPLGFLSPSSSLEGLFKGGTAIVAAAGPSLDKALPWIKAASGRVPVIAVGTALKPLLAAGVRPDFTVLVDSDPKVAAQLDGADPSSLRLLCPLHMPNSLLRRFQRNLVVFSTPVTPGANKLLAERGRLPAQLKTGGTVSLTAVDFARSLGCSKILLAGLDLAVAQDLSSHASNSVYHAMKLRQGELLPVQGSSGESVLTTPQFAVYVEMFNSYLPELAASGVRIFNCSQSGAFLKGCSPCSPDEASRLCLESQPFSPEALELALSQSVRPEGLASLKEVLSKAVEELKERSRLAVSAKELCEAVFRSREAFQRSGTLLANLDLLDKELKSDNLASGLCGEALQPLLINLSESSGCGGSDSFEEAAFKNVTLYDRLAKASEWLSRRLEELIKSI